MCFVKYLSDVFGMSILDLHSYNIFGIHSWNVDVSAHCDFDILEVGAQSTPRRRFS